MVGAQRRRTLLGGALAAGLVGCGSKARPRAAPTATPRADPDPDVEVLLELLGAKRAAVAQLPASPRFADLERADRDHVRQLRAALAVRGAAAPGFDSDSIGDRRAAAAVGAEQRALGAELRALPRLTDRDLRLLVGEMFAADAAHVAILRRAAGRPAVPAAFVSDTP